MSNTKRILPLAIMVGFLLAGCLGITLYGPCAVPKQFEEQDLLGDWKAAYDEHYVSDPVEGTLVISGTVTYLVAPDATPMSLESCKGPAGVVWPDVAWERCPILRGESYLMRGEETLMLNENGTYQHSFVSGTYSYTSPINRWELVEDTPDGPKLRMEGMKYFAEGVAQANSMVNIRLRPQMADQMRVQEFLMASKEVEPFKVVVTYPDDGFIYLYPRLCNGELSLVQMGLHVYDPDDLVVVNPVFRRE